MTPREIQNRIHQVDAAIDQMKNHEHFNDMEKRDSLARLDKELEDLLLLKAKNIEVNFDEVK
jgi:hypothetical protein